MKKSILAGITTFLVLLGVLFLGMFLGGEMAFLQDAEEKIANQSKNEEKERYEPFLEHEKKVVQVVEDNIPAVVSIVASKYVEREIISLDDIFSFSPETETDKRERREEGTGFIISQDGFILTNRHVVEDEDAKYTAILSTGEAVEAKVMARDPIQDLAVLKVKKEDLPVVDMGNSDTVRPGQTAIAIGNALGEFQDTVSKGVISGLGRRVVARGRMTAEVLDDVIQTDAAINFGNSGGPLLNLKGEVIGINTATTMYAEGIGFAIPINAARRVIEGAKGDGRVIYPFLGVQYLIVDRNLKESENLEVDYGALIVSGREHPAITPESAADKAGLKEGDIILEFEGEKITVENSLARIIVRYDPGDEVKIKILREGEEKEISLTLGERD